MFSPEWWGMVDSLSENNKVLEFNNLVTFKSVCILKGMGLFFQESKNWLLDLAESILKKEPHTLRFDKTYPDF